MSTNDYIVYAHLNTVNQKRYIGITNNPKQRWSANGAHYKDSPKFWNAIVKYGWNKFEHIILESGLTQEEARQREIMYIKTYNTISCGYNISAGGDKPPVFYGAQNHNYQKQFSNETRQKMSENHADFSGGKHPRAKHVLCVELDKTFPTITEAALYVNISRSCIREVCEGRQEMSAGYHWKYCDLDL